MYTLCRRVTMRGITRHTTTTITTCLHAIGAPTMVVGDGVTAMPVGISIGIVRGTTPGTRLFTMITAGMTRIGVRRGTPTITTITTALYGRVGVREQVAAVRTMAPTGPLTTPDTAPSTMVTKHPLRRVSRV